MLFINGNTQEIYLSSQENELYKLDVETCSVQFIVNVNAIVYDISFHPNGKLYGINGTGELYEINESTGAATVIADFDGQTFNSLTISGDEVAYAAGNNGTFASYDFKTNEITNRGNLGFKPTGDLTFYDGELYAACSADRIITIDIDSPPLSSIFIQADLDKPIWGIVSYAEKCDDIKTYAVTSQESDIYHIDFINKQLELLCELDITVTGGASTSEFRESNPLAIDSIKTQNPDCAGNGGSLQIFASGGVGNYTYNLNFQQESIDSSYEDLLTGEYIVSVSDGFCEILDTVDIGFLNNLAVQEIITDNATCDIENGSAIVVMEVDNPDLTYTIDNLSFQTSSQFNNLPAGDYSVSITDGGECENIASFSIIQTGSPVIDDILSEVATCDELNGQLDIRTSGGVPPYEYSIDGGMNYQTANLFTSLDSGEYYLIVKDTKNCFVNSTAIIDRIGNPTIDSLSTTTDYCEASVGSVMVSASGLVPLAYKINEGDCQLANEFTDLQSGNYKLTVKDNLGCESEIMVSIIFSKSPIFTNLIPTRTECNKSNGSLEFQVAGGEGAFSLYLNDEKIETTNTIESLSAGDYTLNVVDSLGCEGVDSFSIGRKGCTVFIPNAFSPNGDQHNDKFSIIPQNGFEGEILSINIFDRWGQPVYSNEGKKSNSWDGTVDGRVVTAGVYIYSVAVVHFDGKRELFKGDVTVLD